MTIDHDTQQELCNDPFLEAADLIACALHHVSTAPRHKTDPETWHKLDDVETALFAAREKIIEVSGDYRFSICAGELNKWGRYEGPPLTKDRPAT